MAPRRGRLLAESATAIGTRRSKTLPQSAQRSAEYAEVKPTANCKLPTADCQRQTAKTKPPRANEPSLLCLRSALGRLLLAVCCWPFAVGRLLLAVCCWPFAVGRFAFGRSLLPSAASF